MALGIFDRLLTAFFSFLISTLLRNTDLYNWVYVKIVLHFLTQALIGLLTIEVSGIYFVFVYFCSFFFFSSFKKVGCKSRQSVSKIT